MTGICLFRQKMMLRQIFCSKTLKHWHSKVHFFASNESFDDFQVFLLISADPGDQWSLRSTGRTTLNPPAPNQTLKFSKILSLECNTVVKRLSVTWNERSWVWIPPGFFFLLFIFVSISMVGSETGLSKRCHATYFPNKKCMFSHLAKCSLWESKHNLLIISQKFLLIYRPDWTSSLVCFGCRHTML